MSLPRAKRIFISRSDPLIADKREVLIRKAQNHIRKHNQVPDWARRKGEAKKRANRPIGQNEDMARMMNGLLFDPSHPDLKRTIFGHKEREIKDSHLIGLLALREPYSAEGFGAPIQKARAARRWLMSRGFGKSGLELRLTDKNIRRIIALRDEFKKEYGKNI